MIELPEAVVMAEQINNTLLGKKILCVIANHTPHTFAWYTGNPENYNSLLAGKIIHDAEAIGDHIEIKVEDMILHLSTPIRYHDASAKRPLKHQLLIEFDDATAVSATVQMWGNLLCFKAGETNGLDYYNHSWSQPSPLSDAFDKDYFIGLFQKADKKLSAKAFLATEQRIQGIGNGVLQDILWTACIHPKRKLNSMTDSEIDHMYNAIKFVLKQMVLKKGRDTEKDLFGRSGGYKTVLSKNTVNEPCPICGTIIKKEAYLGGSIYFCEICQPCAKP